MVVPRSISMSAQHFAHESFEAYGRNYYVEPIALCEHLMEWNGMIKTPRACHILSYCLTTHQHKEPAVIAERVLVMISR